MWNEVEAAKRENKRELKLSGVAISERLAVQSGQLDRHIFDLSTLNLLNISDTSLTVLPDQISNLTNLQTLLLFGNQLEQLPAAIGALEKLKVLDVSRNRLTSLPAEIAQLTQLATVNVSNNALESFPQLTLCAKLSVLDVSNNKLTQFPDVCTEELSNLSEVQARCNQIAQIPQDIVQLTALKSLSLVSNQVVVVPKVLASMSKLKELTLEDNPIADKRLYKLILQCRTKQILDYVKQNGAAAPKIDPVAAAAAAERQATADLAAGGATVTGKSKKSGGANASAAVRQLHSILIKRPTDESFHMQYAEAVREVRPHILCCVVRQVRLAENNGFKRFLQIQSRLHDSVCERREKSTIATHDLAKIKGGFVRYTANAPAALQIVPLNKVKQVSGRKMFDSLKAEAETLRKEKKRNVYSGIHKYLYLLERLTSFACLEDGQSTVISLPPLTNADQTKISPETTDVFVEVTSATSMADCRAAIEELLVEMLLAGLGTPDVDADEAAAEGAEVAQHLIVEQVRSTDLNAHPRAIYPSKNDLKFEESRPSIRVVRE